MRRLVAGLMAGALLGTGSAWATSAGDLITNVATVTFWSGPLDQVPFELTYNVTATVRVVVPVVSIVKYSHATPVAAGGTVTFTVCILNDRDVSVWNATVTDVLPTGMGYVGASMGYNASTPPPGTVLAYTARSATGAAGSWAAGDAPAGQAGPYYMRWGFNQYIGPLRSACVQFTMVIQ